jgi:translocation and assembly module TamB
MPQTPQEETMSALAHSALNVNGQLDVAKLAAQLPNTLHVRAGTKITSGQVRLSLASKPDATVQTWSGQFVASDLAADYQGRRLTWDQPIQLQATVHAQAGNYSIEGLNCSSSFLTLAGQGSLDQFQAEAQCDLDRLMSELSQFVDLGEFRLAGKGDGHLRWSHGISGEFQTSGDLRLQGLRIAVPGQPVWQEDAVAASVTAAGSIDNLTCASLTTAKLQRLDAAQFTATVDNTAANTHEQIDAKLLQAENGLSAANRWPVEIHAQGQLGRWWPRIAAWTGIKDIDLSGAATVAVQAAFSSQGLEIQQASATFNGLHAWGWNSVFIDEPVAQMQAMGNYDFARNQLTLNRTALLTSTVSLQTDTTTVAWRRDGPPAVQGNLAYQADLTRLSRWLNDPRVPPKYVLAGRLIGNVDIDHSGPGINGKLDAGIDNFAVYAAADAGSKSSNALRETQAQGPQLVWQENKLTLAAAGNVDGAADALQLTSLDVNSQALALHAAGKIDAISTKQNVELAGKIDYDWATLGPLLRPYLGDRVAIAGRQSRDFAVHGSLHGDVQNAAVAVAMPSGVAPGAANIEPDKFACLRGLTGDASLGWTQAQLYGMSTGPIDLNAHLENGTVELKPIETVLASQRGSGQLSVAPLIHLTPSPAEVVLGKGTVLSNVQFSEELSESWIKFIAPMVSGSARTEGSFSVELDGGHVPLDDPKKADIGGRLIVQNMTVTPGPLFRPFAVIGQEVEAIVMGRLPMGGLSGETSLLKIDDQKVDFHLVDGRVYHQGLSMQVGQVTMRTRGWVGLDESVNIVVEIPLKEEWTQQRNSPLASLDEPVIRIPIVGNLKDPKFDTRVTTKLMEALPRAAVQSGLNNVLDHILPQR